MNKLSKTRFAHESNALSNAVANYLMNNFKIVDSYLKKIIESRNLLKKELCELGIKARGETGNYLLLDLRSKEIARNFVEYLRQQKIYVKGPWKNQYDQFITITLGPYSEMQRFIKAAEIFISEKFS